MEKPELIMCAVHFPLLCHPGDLQGWVCLFLSDEDKHKCGLSPANKSRPPARGDEEPGTAAKSERRESPEARANSELTETMSRQ